LQAVSNKPIRHVATQAVGNEQIVIHIKPFQMVSCGWNVAARRKDLVFVGRRSVGGENHDGPLPRYS
jgi:hypothetical protein